MAVSDNDNHYKVLIIGAGFSGLCMGIMLRRAGYTDFKILEKSAELGGTWQANTYPGAECDIPSALYSYSFESNAHWDYKWAGQEQIHRYQKNTAQKHGLIPHVQSGTEVESAYYLEPEQVWRVKCTQGQQYTAQHLVAAVGQLHHPFIPQITGQQDFAGRAFHTARWDHDLDLTNKRVAVIGSAATAVQFIPKIASQVEQLTIYQRSPNWILPKVDRAYTRPEQWLSEKIPALQKLYRLGLWLRGEWVLLPAIRGNRVMRWLLRTWNRHLLKQSISDPALIQALTPVYPIGAKRILLADDYYSTLARDNVELVTELVDHFSQDGIVDSAHTQRQHDVVIYSTGFKTNPFLAPMKIVGLEQRLLSDHWAQGAHAYLGVSTVGFPNLHMLYGPNTNLGHNSILLMVEAQVGYIIELIKRLDQSQYRAADIKPEIEATYNKEIQARLANTAFAEINDSWYQDQGRITNNWPGGTGEYKRRMRHLNLNDYQLY